MSATLTKYIDDLIQHFHYKPTTKVDDRINRFVAWYGDYSKV